ncbi:hypothetical protein HELRODRAFT_174923 [Helobdella robusta]|uniref:Rho-GAP domain-containing protein n=1 Tax=Helobdella robusta TaxID=6412 RepID=T1F8M2_HELRO|nr:hypothetical protein HELRODRAFT_174923 [Helobdella robusta]ESO01368.1 hypothetical protein HELRODRAFT_174923 [Helobdella robusta]
MEGAIYEDLIITTPTSPPPTTTKPKNNNIMEGYLDCSRIDVSDKVVGDNANKRLYLFASQGILSFFNERVNFDSGCKPCLPIETVFLKDALIKRSNTSNTGFKILCRNGVCYTFSGRCGEDVSAWIKFLTKTIQNLVDSPVAMTLQLKKTKLMAILNKRSTKNELSQKGIYKDAAFGASLETYCMQKNCIGPPLFLRLCIQEIEKRGLKEDGLYRKGGSISEIQAVRVQINQDVFNFSKVQDIHTLTSLVKLYFRELSSPLIHPHLFIQFFQSVGLGGEQTCLNALLALVNGLNTVHYHTLHYLVDHLKKVAKESESNRMTNSNLSIVFGPTLAWMEAVKDDGTILVVKQAKLVQLIIEKSDYLFKN